MPSQKNGQCYALAVFCILSEIGNSLTYPTCITPKQALYTDAVLTKSAFGIEPLICHGINATASTFATRFLKTWGRMIRIEITQVKLNPRPFSATPHKHNPTISNHRFGRSADCATTTQRLHLSDERFRLVGAVFQPPGLESGLDSSSM